MHDMRRFITLVEYQKAIRDSDVWGDDYKILKNPTKRELAKMAQEYHDWYIELRGKGDISDENDVSEEQDVRTLYDPVTRDTYAWGGLHNTHDYVAQMLGLPDYSKGVVFYDADTGMAEFRNYENAQESWSQPMRESAEPPEQRLADLIKRRDELVHHWNTVIKPTQPPEVHEYDPEAWAASNRWWADPEKGRVWPEQIYPLNQEIEKLEAEVKRQKRTAKLQTKRDDTNGFDTSEVLYHGTDAEFEAFDRKMARTASHIYTSPDLSTSEKYGAHVYAVYGRQEPQAVLTAEDCDYKVLRKVYRKGNYKRNHGLSLNDFAELVTNAELYNYDYKGNFQDEVVDDCLALGYRSVRITDGKPGGGYSDSVIFGDPANLEIIEKVE